MRKTVTLIALSLSVLLAGCSKDADVSAFINELDGATKEIVEKIDANPTSAGIDAAHKAFDGRKPQLSEKWNNIKGAVGVQVSGDTKKKLEESVKNNMKALTEVSMRNMLKMASDKEATIKFQRLMTEYGKTFQL